MKLFLFLIALFFALSCAAIPLSPETQQKVAIAAGCAVFAQGGCMDDANVQAAFPGLDEGNCPARVEYLRDIVKAGANGMPNVNTALVVLDKIDLSKVNFSKLSKLKKAKCSAVEKYLGLK